MKLWPLGVLALGAAGMFWPSSRAADEWTLVIAGDFDGYLSPCGCTKPMSGGIRRMATALKQLGAKDRTAFLVNGGLVIGRTRQDEIKAESLAESFGAMGVAAVNLSPADAKLGPGSVLSIDRLSGTKTVTGAIQESARLRIPANRRIGPFLVGGVAADPDSIARALEETARPVEEAVQELVEQAQADGATPLLLFQGTLAEARSLAAKHPEIPLIVYRAAGDPPKEPVKEGGTWLVTPGEFGKYVVRLRWRDGRPTDYASLNLSEDLTDEPAVARIFKTYLTRVDEEGLLDQTPRRDTPAFAGSEACGKCHTLAYRVWKISDHAHALKSLESVGQSRDPDCVACHVVGLESTVGFRSRRSTPKLANVGCESCHGPAARHAAAPKRSKPEPIKRGLCGKCHDVNHSPNFDFHKAWPKIAHPSGKPVDKMSLQNSVNGRKATKTKENSRD